MVYYRHWPHVWPSIVPAGSPMLRVALLGIALLAMSGRAHAQLPVTELTSIFPPGGQLGSSVELQTTGANQEEGVRLVFSHSGITAEAKEAKRHEFLPNPQPVAGQFVVSISEEVPPGIYDVWLVGRFGVSNPRSFVVGSWEEIRASGSHRQPSMAQELTVPVTVNATAAANATDYYKLKLQAGQRVLIEGWAERIDSRMDASLAILDEEGRELARNLDLDGYDPLLDFTAPRDGDYVIAVWDFLYEGGPTHFYRLQVHGSARVDYVFPPAGLPGSQMQTTVFGRNLPGGRPTGHVLLDGVELEALDVNISLPSDPTTLTVGGYLAASSVSLDGIPFAMGASAPVLIGFAQAPVIRESEPNDRPETAQIIPVPSEVAGQFFPSRDQDWFQFEMKQGETFILDVISQRMGRATDPLMIIERLSRDGEGNVTSSVVAQVDDSLNRNNLIGSPFDTSTDDPSYRLTADADAAYRVMVRDQFGDGQDDPRRIYRLAIRRPEPDFRLHAVPQEIKVANNNEVRLTALALRRGGTNVLRVAAERLDGFAEPITVHVEGLPEGVSCEPAWLGPNQDTLWLVLKASDDAEAWAGPIQIVGKAAQGDREIVRAARPGAVTWGSANTTQTRAEFRLARKMMLAVIPETIAVHLEAATAGLSETPLLETSLGGKLEIPLQLVRREGFAEAVKLVATNLPAEVKPADVDIAADQSAGTLALTITNAKAQPGIYSFYLRADTKVSYRRNPEAVTRAEEELKQLVEQVAELTDQVAQKTAARDAAAQEVEKTAAAVATAKTGSDEAAAAAALAEKAEKDRAAAEQALQEVQKQLQRATEVKEAEEKRLEELKKGSQPADVNIALISTPIQLRVVRTPLSLAAAQPMVRVEKGSSAPAEVTLARHYGFADAVQLTVEAPPGVTGLTAEAISLAADQEKAAITLVAAEDATAGTHAVVVRAKAKFNDIDVDDAVTLTVTIP